MRFTTKCLPYAALLASTLAEPGPCDPQTLLAPPWTIGDVNNPGNPFCSTAGSNRAPVSQLEIWTSSDGDHIAGMQFVFADGTKGQLYGLETSTSSYPSKSLNLAQGELVTHAVLYGNGVGKFLGHIHIETDKGQTFDAGKSSIDSIHPYGLNVGGGLLIGGSGHYDDNNIYNAALLFLAQPVEKVSIGNIKYDTSDLDNQAAVSPSTINVGSYYNNADTNITAWQQQTSSVTKSHTFTQMTSSKFGLGEDIEISGELFGLGAKATTKINWELTNEWSDAVTETHTQQLMCQFNAPVAPHTGIKATGTFANGTTTVPYSSTVNVTLKDGNWYSYPENGELAVTDYTDCRVQIDNDDDPTMPSTAKISNPPGSKRSLVEMLWKA